MLLLVVGFGFAVGLISWEPEQPSASGPSERTEASANAAPPAKSAEPPAPRVEAVKPAAAPKAITKPVSPRTGASKPPTPAAPPSPPAPVATAGRLPVNNVKVAGDQASQAIYQADTPVPATPLAGARRIDELVFARLQEKGITPAAPCSDAVFVRRVYLDVIGTLPTAEEARSFLEDARPDRRQVLIDRLLERPEFADYWAMKWGDILRVKSEFPINLWPNAVWTYHRWIRSAVRQNMPYDQFARALLTSSGSNFREPPANFYRAVQGRKPKNLAHAVALTFMGVRPEGLPAERWSGVEAFFSQVAYKPTREWKEEIVFFDASAPLSGVPVFPDGTTASPAASQDPRQVFADWLITPENPWFTRNIANRAWYWLLGRGIIHEPDDIRPDNPPSNPELLAHLERELVAAKYDLKHLFRLILNSRTYQFSCVPAGEHPEAAALFAYYPVRRLEAEVLIDAICQITGTSELYYSPIPEPFTYLPHGHRAISIPDASISSPFLEMFGRPARDTGLESERNNAFTSGQRLHLLNSAHIRQKLEKGPGLAQLLRPGNDREKTVEGLYLTILSRHPTPGELSVAANQGLAGAPDIAWALLNSAEFLCRH
jgi:hypothetical protein